MKQKLLHILLNQYVITALITIAIISVLPDYFSKYKVEVCQARKHWRKQYCLLLRLKRR